MNPLIIIGALIASLLFIKVSANPDYDSNIGYTYDGTKTHIWNQGEIKQDYYYTGSCNQQLSNLPEEVWEKVVLGMTYGDTNEDLVNNYVELQTGNCNRIEQTDNQTYVNITVWKSVSYLGKTGILAKESYIELNDNYMRETFMFKSNDNINQNIYFVLKRDNIDISNNNKDDFLKVYGLDNNEYIMNLSYAEANNLIISKNQDEVKKGLFLIDYDTKENIMFYQNTSTDYTYILNRSNILLSFNAGTFSIGQTKSLETYWVDAGCSCLPGWTGTLVEMDSVPSSAYEMNNSDVRVRVNYQGDTCAGDSLYLEDNTTGVYAIIPTTDTNDLDCSGAICRVDNPSDGVWYSKNIDWENIGNWTLAPYWECNGDSAYGSPSNINVYMNKNPTIDANMVNPSIVGNFETSNITVYNSDSINFTGNFSSNMWFFPLFDQTIWVNHYFLDKRGGSANALGFRLFFAGANEDFRFRFTNSTGSSVNCDTVGVKFNDSQWYNLQVTYDSQRVNIFLNNTIYGNCSLTGGISKSPYDLLIAGSASSFTGGMDEVMIYNVYNNESVRTGLYNQGRFTNTTTYTEGRVLYLSMDEAVGSTTADVSGNSNDGLIPSEKWWEGLIIGAYCNGEFNGSDHVYLNKSIFCNETIPVFPIFLDYGNIRFGSKFAVLEVE